MLRPTCGVLLLAALLACCWARHAPGQPTVNDTAWLSQRSALVDQQAVLEMAETGTVPLNTLLIAIAQSPRLPDKRNAADEKPEELETRFGPFGQILELERNSPSDEKVLVESEPLTPLDFERASFMPLLPLPRDEDDPLNREEYFEGDIIIPVRDYVTLNEDSAAIEPHKLWPGGVVYYAMSRQFDRQERATIARAVMEFERHTCLKVKPLPPGDTSRHYVNVVKKKGCYSGVGRMASTGGRSQEMSLGKGCIFPGIVMHEFMHVFGFWHEQSRPDRDQHVFVHTDNIRPAMLINFKKYESDKVQTLGEPYDIGSIMHYGRYAFARDKSRPTLSDRLNTGITMGQRRGFSKIDIRKLNRLYGCDDVSPTVAPPPVVGGGDKCKDKHEYCPYWARRGECSKNKPYMHKFCRRSCKKCTDGTCADLHRMCRGWASKRECRRNPNYMLIYCRKSCKVCSGANTCRDRHRLCDYWARTDECVINPEFMHLYCKVSCNKC